jgi:hypothetical protein
MVSTIIKIQHEEKIDNKKKDRKFSTNKNYKAHSHFFYVI